MDESICVASVTFRVHIIVVEAQKTNEREVSGLEATLVKKQTIFFSRERASLGAKQEPTFFIETNP